MSFQIRPKSIIEFKNLSRLDDDFLVRIFDEIRAFQAAKKIKSVHGQEVSSIQEAEKFDKNIYRKDIELLVINRVIGNDLFASRAIPLYFMQEVQRMDTDDIADLIQECQAKISRTIFNKNNKRSFWLLLEEIMMILGKNDAEEIHSVLNQIPTQVKNKMFTLDDSALLYLIALVKEGLRNENS